MASFDRQLLTERLEIPYASHGVLGEMREHVRVLSEEYGRTNTALVRATPENLGRLKKRLTEQGRRSGRQP